MAQLVVNFRRNLPGGSGPGQPTVAQHSANSLSVSSSKKAGKPPLHPQLTRGALTSAPQEVVAAGKPPQRRSSPAGPVAIYAPARDSDASTSSADSEDTTVPSIPVTSISRDLDSFRPSSTVSSSQILSPVQEDMQIMNSNLRSIVGNRHPLLVAAAENIFGAGGKKLRPAIVFLVARATAQLMGMRDINDQQRRLAEITEMIHTASLVHDDVVDDATTRRGKQTVNSVFGTKVAVLAGDYLFAQSSWFIANLDNLEVIKLISQVIADFANGEVSQLAARYDTDLTLQQYMDKSFYKTATLIAASCKSAAIFSGVSVEVKNAMFEYGRHLGLAFQIVDDILDFTQTSEQLGKPQGQDLASGNLTAPAVFALAGTEGPALRELVEREFGEEGDLWRAIELVQAGGGVQQARNLARQEADLALDALRCLWDCPAKRSLELMVDYVLDRLY